MSEACTHPATDECVHPAIRFLDCETCPPGLCPVIICVACGEEVDRENGHAKVKGALRRWLPFVLLGIVLAVCFALAETALLSSVVTPAYGNDPRANFPGHR